MIAMKQLLLIVAIFCVCSKVETFLICPSLPAKWCETKETAALCKVTEQCQQFVWKSAFSVPQDIYRLNFTIYYESLCADCRQFIITQVWNAFESVPEIVNLTLIPFGNAYEVYRPETKLYQFYCQHGPDECYGNLIHSCAIGIYPDVKQHFPFINCMDTVFGDLETVAEQCARNTSIDLTPILQCVNSRSGNQMQHFYAVQTETNKPKDAFVPWVTLNGQHTEDIQEQAQINLIRLLCKNYKGPQSPAGCQQI